MELTCKIIFQTKKDNPDLNSFHMYIKTCQNYYSISEYMTIFEKKKIAIFVVDFQSFTINPQDMATEYKGNAILKF